MMNAQQVFKYQLENIKNGIVCSPSLRLGSRIQGHDLRRS